MRLTKNKKTGEFYAMKILKKHEIIKTKQVDHVISENSILVEIEHPFLVRFLTGRWASKALRKTHGTCTS